jgi:hypothetical protein
MGVVLVYVQGLIEISLRQLVKASLVLRPRLDGKIY